LLKRKPTSLPQSLLKPLVVPRLVVSEPLVVQGVVLESQPGDEPEPLVVQGVVLDTQPHMRPLIVPKVLKQCGTPPLSPTHVKMYTEEGGWLNVLTPSKKATIASVYV
jgi:hypothetical protein